MAYRSYRWPWLSIDKKQKKQTFNKYERQSIESPNHNKSYEPLLCLASEWDSCFLEYIKSRQTERVSWL